MLKHDYLCRDGELNGRTLTVACVPFDVAAPVSDDGLTVYLEAFDRGAFAAVTRAPNRTVLRREHSHDEALTVAKQLTEEPDTLIGVFDVGHSEDADRLLEDWNAGEFGGVSLGFVPGDHVGDNEIVDGVTRRRRVKSLREVSFVKDPAFASTGVLAIRSDAARRAAIEREHWHWLTLRA